MIFTSTLFFFFFILIYSIYLFFQKKKNSHKYQNILLLLASYWFYGAWNYNFLSLILLSTLLDYMISLSIVKTNTRKKKKLYLTISIVANLGMLGIFKYLNFGIENFIILMEYFGIKGHYSTLSIILPIGISFYTFQTMSYTIDTYRGEIKPTKNFIDFALYVSFFPQLVAGPIEKATNLLPQILKPRNISKNDISKGVYWILIGYFKKIVIADNMASYVEYSIDHLNSTSGMISFLGIMAFSLQIYGDFAGYTYIARGISKLMGFDLMQNFKRPYLASSPSDFWRRWHISLSQWLRNYLYFSLGGSKNSNLKKYRNLMITMLIGGLWHGASWNFVIWGGYHGTILIIYHFLKDKGLLHSKENYNPIRKFFNVTGMYMLTLFGWLLFRLTDINILPQFLKNIFTNFQFTDKLLYFGLPIIVTFIGLISLHILQELEKDELIILNLPSHVKFCIYSTLLILTISAWGEPIPFIYFQF